MYLMRGNYKLSYMATIKVSGITILNKIINGFKNFCLFLGNTVYQLAGFKNKAFHF